MSDQNANNQYPPPNEWQAPSVPPSAAPVNPPVAPPVVPAAAPVPPPAAPASPPVAPTAAPVSPPVNPVPTPGYFPPAGQAVAAPLPPTSEVIDYAPVEVAEKKGIAGRVAVVGLVLALIGGAGAFAINAALSKPAGAESPEALADQLVDAYEKEDLLAIFEMLAPSEREAFVEPSMALLTEIARLEGSEFDPEDTNEYPGDLATEEITYEIEQLGEGVYWLTTTGGTASYYLDPAQVPDWAAKLYDGEVTAESDESDLGDDPMEFAIIEEDGSYYWSATYSMAEMIRLLADQPVPTFGSGLVPVGADSPTETMETAMRSLLDFDLNGAATQLDPSEFRAFYDYAPLFMPDATQALDDLAVEAESAGFSAELSNLAITSDEVDGRTLVYVESFDINIVVEEGSSPILFSFADGCATYTVDGETTDLCEEMEGADVMGLDFGTDSDFRAGWQVVERDGRWYLSGFPAILGIYTDVLKTMSPDDWDAFKSGFTDGFDDGLSSLPQDMFGGTDYETVEPYVEDSDYTVIEPDDGTDNETYDTEIYESEPYTELDAAFVAPGFTPFSSAPADSYATFALDIGTPVTSTSLYGDGTGAIATDASMELWEYDSADSVTGSETYLVEYWACELIGEHAYGPDVVVVECPAETYISYDRWVLQTWNLGDDASTVLTVELEHLRALN